MKLFYALLVFVNGELQGKRTVYFYSLYDCIEHARLLNMNTFINGSKVDAQCLPEWRPYAQKPTK